MNTIEAIIDKFKIENVNYKRLKESCLWRLLIKFYEF